MDLQLSKKIALVTGSTAGIGNAIAASLAREGASVIVNGRTQPAVDAAVETIRAQTGGDVLDIDPENYWDGIYYWFRSRGLDPHPWRRQ